MTYTDNPEEIRSKVAENIATADRCLLVTVDKDKVRTIVWVNHPELAMVMLSSLMETLKTHTLQHYEPSAMFEESTY